MAIARNRKKEPDVAAIAAFGAAAESRNDQAAPTSTTTRRAQEEPRGSTATKALSAGETDGPKASLVRWASEKELRDDLMAYGKRNRYNMQELMIETMRRGLAEMRASES
jgi:hypothetical protein